MKVIAGNTCVTFGIVLLLNISVAGWRNVLLLTKRRFQISTKSVLVLIIFCVALRRRLPRQQTMQRGMEHSWTTK